jgi:tRNA threonylcarbamoyladenosine biosynthesis protein TsaB
MRILALDAATEACSVALLQGEELLLRTVESGRGHAPQLQAMVSELLGKAQLSLSQLDGIAAGIGPGAFTGVRITVAVAQGLAFGAGLAVVPIVTLEALAFQLLAGPAGSAAAPSEQAPRQGRPGAAAPRAFACLDARMGEVYWACYAADARSGVVATSTPRVGPPRGIVLPADRYWGVGRGFAAYPELGRLAGVELMQGREAALPNARELARLGALRLALGGGIDPAKLEPLYLRDKVAATLEERAAPGRD